MTTPGNSHGRIIFWSTLIKEIYQSSCRLNVGIFYELSKTKSIFGLTQIHPSFISNTFIVFKVSKIFWPSFRWGIWRIALLDNVFVAVDSHWQIYRNRLRLIHK